MKVYLSKSNASSYEAYSLLKKELISTGHEIVEHTGGVYSNKTLLECDMIIILPGENVLIPDVTNDHSHYLFDNDDKPKPYYIGKGQYCQLNEFIHSKSNLTHKVFAVTEIYMEGEKIDVYFESIKASQLVDDKDWKFKHAELILSGDTVTFYDILPQLYIPNFEKPVEIVSNITVIPHLALYMF